VENHVARHADGAEHPDEADGYMIDHGLVQTQASGHTPTHPIGKGRSKTRQISK
jgi:hypothetical protein